MWWRRLHGDEVNLDDTHLMRLAGRFVRRVRGWAAFNGVPVVGCGRGERKHQIASEYLASHSVGPGCSWSWLPGLRFRCGTCGGQHGGVMRSARRGDQEPGEEDRVRQPVGSDRGALPGSLPAGFPGPTRLG